MISEIGIGAVMVAWFGSLELRIRNHVGKERFQDLKDEVCHVKKRLFHVDKKIDMLLIHNSLIPPKEDD